MADIRSEFIRKMAQSKKQIVESAKKPASTGFLSDQEVCDVLGLEDGVNTPVVCRLVRIQFGVDKNKHLYYRDSFVVMEGPGKGTPFGKYHTLSKKDDRYEQELDNLFRIYQNLGVDTTEWKEKDVLEKMYDTAVELSASRPTCRMSMSRYVPDDPEKEHRLNYNILALIEGDFTPAPADEEPEEEVEDEEHEDEDQEAEEETEDDDSDEPEEGDDDTDWSEYIGYSAMFDTGDGPVEVTTTEWDEDSGTYTVEDAEGESYDAYPDDLEWIEE